MNHRIRKMQSLIEAVDNAIAQIKLLLINDNNDHWNHNHIGILNETLKMLKNIKFFPLEQVLRRDLGRLVSDNDGIDFPENLQSLLFQISTANPKIELNEYKADMISTSI